MTVARLITYCLLIFVLALCALGYYVYRSYPENIEQALVRQLAPYGITELDIESLRLGGRALTFEGLALGGSSAAQTYSVTLRGLSIGFHWRDLIDGQLGAITIASVDLALEPGEQTSPQADATPVDLAQFLPSATFGAIPVHSLVVERLQLTYPTPLGELVVAGKVDFSPEQLEASGSTELLGVAMTFETLATAQDKIALSVRAQHQGETLTDITATLQDTDASQWAWQTEGQLYFARALAWLRDEPARDVLPSLALPEALAVAGYSDITAIVTHPATFGGDAGDTSTPYSLAAEATHHVQELALASLGVVKPFDLGTELSAKPGSAQLTLAATDIMLDARGATVGLSPEALKQLGWRETIPVRFELQETAVMTYRSTGQQLSVDAGAVSVNIGNASTRVVLSADTLALEQELTAPPPGPAASTAPSIAAGRTSAVRGAGSLNLRVRGKPLPRFNYTLSAEGPADRIVLAAALRDIAQSVEIDVDGVVDAGSGAADAQVALRTLDLPYLAGTTTELLRAFDLLEQPVSLTGGSVRLQTALRTNSVSPLDITQTSHIEAAGVAGKIGEYAFSGLGATARFKGIETLETLEPASIELDAFDAGFPISKLRAVVTLPRPTPAAAPLFAVETFSADLFGGSIRLTQRTPWQVGAQSNALRVRAENWQLSDLVALQQGEDIAAVGRLEGELPLTIEEGRILIERGFLRAIPPGGSIRYQATDKAAQLASSNEQLGMAIELLEDFQFDVLSTEVRLDKAGNLALGLALSGRNPMQFSGRQVNFNINVDQNIDPLLQSLRLGDAIVKKLENRVR